MIVENEIKFKNKAPEDEEWSAHISIMNEWQNPERILRDIVQYARSGPFYPADMHVDLIEQWHNHQQLALFKRFTDDLHELADGNTGEGIWELHDKYEAELKELEK